jgi:hypothetical protein
MSDPEQAIRLPPTIEDMEVALVHSLALLSASADDLTCAGYTVTHPHACRRSRLGGVRSAIIAAREMEHRLSILQDELMTLLRRLDPLSEMLPEGNS